MSKEYVTQAEEREQTIPENKRYTYIGSLVTVDCVGYPVVSAIPLGTSECTLPTAEEKISKLVEGN
ncbi:MAG: hypothetical protein IJG87_10260 [Ruminococcus sp.]|nr:hypothetical protein [Ruminococcus sp.]